MKAGQNKLSQISTCERSSLAKSRSTLRSSVSACHNSVAFASGTLSTFGTKPVRIRL